MFRPPETNNCRSCGQTFDFEKISRWQSVKHAFRCGREAARKRNRKRLSGFLGWMLAALFFTESQEGD